jgi:2-methylcitrate dehydratase PrpD
MITEKLASMVVNTEYDELPEEVINKTKQCFTDFLAVSLAGSKTQSTEKVKSIFNNGCESTVIGDEMFNCTDASLINAVSAHSLDLDDGHRFAQIHPGCSVFPAALSLAEARNIRGKDFICSIIAGYQVSIIMGMISNPEHRALGFHSTGTCGTFGAAAASCRVLRLGFDETVNALGLAGTQASGLLESDHSGSMGKHLHAGKAAQSGVISAILAEKGFTSTNSIIEGFEGFLNAMVVPGDISTINLENLKDKAYNIISDKKYHIMNVYFKKYPVCRHLHSSIDATIRLYNQMKLKQVKSEDIKSIIIKTYKIASEHDNYHPLTIEAVRQSLPFTVAISILNGDVNIHNIEINPQTISMASKVFIELDEGMERLYPLKRPSKVTVTTKNESYTCRIDLPVGEPENPIDQQNLIKKFHDINPEVDLDVLNVINKLESYNMSDLMNILNNEFTNFA